MKKLIFTAVLAIGGLSTTLASVNTMAHPMIVVANEEFKEIPIDQLPAAVTEALATAHAGAAIDKAYVNENEQYKLEVTTEDGTSVTLYADAEGNWLQMD